MYQFMSRLRFTLMQRFCMYVTQFGTFLCCPLQKQQSKITKLEVSWRTWQWIFLHLSDLECYPTNSVLDSLVTFNQDHKLKESQKVLSNMNYFNDDFYMLLPLWFCEFPNEVRTKSLQTEIDFFKKSYYLLNINCTWQHFCMCLSALLNQFI